MCWFTRLINKWVNKWMKKSQLIGHRFIVIWNEILICVSSLFQVLISHIQFCRCLPRQNRLHHIVGFASFEDINYFVFNRISLCSHTLPDIFMKNTPTEMQRWKQPKTNAGNWVIEALTCSLLTRMDINYTEPMTRVTFFFQFTYIASDRLAPCASHSINVAHALIIITDVL